MFMIQIQIHDLLQTNCVKQTEAAAELLLKQNQLVQKLNVLLNLKLRSYRWRRN